MRVQAVVRSKSQSMMELEEAKSETASFNSVQMVHEQSDHDMQCGEWSEVVAVQTLPPQSLESGEHIQTTKKGVDVVVHFDRTGMIRARNPYHFGVVSWDVKMLLSSHSLGEDENACLMVGVVQQGSKRGALIGSTVNYGLQRDSLKIRVTLDFGKHQMLISTPACPQGELFNNLPPGPLYPVSTAHVSDKAFMNKSNDKNLSGLKIAVTFES